MNQNVVYLGVHPCGHLKYGPFFCSWKECSIDVKYAYILLVDGVVGSC